LAAELLAGRHGGEPVVFVGNYYYDVGFYARLDMPAIVVDRWLPEEVARDSWRRELMDGQGFNTPGSPRRLIRADALAETLCRAPRTWAIGRWPATQETARLARLTPVYTSGVTALWRIEPADPIVRAALGCGETPQAPEGIRSFR
jgi:hypothetical protein